MEKSQKIKLGIVYVLVLFIAIFLDMTGGKLKENTILYRDKTGGDTTAVDLVLNVEDILKDYDMHLEIAPRLATKEEAETYFLKAIEEIEEDFQKIGKKIPLETSYETGLVKAEWSFSPSGIIGADGEIREEKVPKEGVLITAKVVLACGVYEELYSFAFRLEKPVLTQKEELEKKLQLWLENQQKLEGADVFELPTRLDGFSMEWKEKREWLCLKILFLELASILLLIVARKKEQENIEKKRRQKRELQYPEISNQLLVLLETGMTARQAWHKMAYQYKEKRKKLLIPESEVYEAILQMDRRLSDGENEKTVYEGFVNQMDVMCYRRLIRLLVHNLEKGSGDICQQLHLEAKQAYEQRILLAKKLGEEASTKMLIPMMLMMVLVMIIVIAPAVMGFSI